MTECEVSTPRQASLAKWPIVVVSGLSLYSAGIGWSYGVASGLVVAGLGLLSLGIAAAVLTEKRRPQ